MIESATGKTAFSAGKPSPIIFFEAIRDMNAVDHDIHMIGDTMSTDILGAVQSQLKSILVLSGGTKKEDIEQYSYAPTYVLNSIAEAIQLPQLHYHFSKTKVTKKSTKPLNVIHKPQAI
jgi:NagD protein